MKKLQYIYLKPQHYYTHLFTFFILIAFSLTLILVQFKIENLEIFLLKFFIILFLLLSISALIEIIKKGEYMSPLEIYDIENFFNKFLKFAHNKNGHINNFFNKYDNKSKKKFENTFRNNKNYLLSSITKKKNIYEITIINERKLFEYFFIKFLVKNAINKVYIKKINEKFKIIRIS